MILLFVMLIVVLFASAYNEGKKLQEEANKKLQGKDFVIEEVAKFCPPHKWRYLEVKDTEGNTVKWRLICDLCGPLKPSNGPARMDY